MLLCVLSTTVNQEAQELLDEIQQQPGVFVLSGPAVAITVNSWLMDGRLPTLFQPQFTNSKKIQIPQKR